MTDENSLMHSKTWSMLITALCVCSFWKLGGERERGGRNLSNAGRHKKSFIFVSRLGIERNEGGGRNGERRGEEGGREEDQDMQHAANAPPQSGGKEICHGLYIRNF